MEPRALFPEVTVNGQTIPQADIAAEAQNHAAPKGKPGIAWRKAADAVVIRALLLQEAKSRGLTPDCQELAPGKFETEEEALIRGLLDLSVDADAPTAEAVREEWLKDPSRFRAPPLWEVSHILCACDPRDEAARKKALTRANALLAKVKEVPEGFAALAKSDSDCGSKSAGGTLGQLGPGDTVPEFEAALRDLADGDITPAPVLTRHGYHIIRMDAVAEGQVLPFEVVQGKIAEAMEKAGWARAAKAYVTSLVDAAEISGVELRSA